MASSDAIFCNSAEILAQPIPAIGKKVQKHLFPIAGTELSYNFS